MPATPKEVNHDAPHHIRDASWVGEVGAQRQHLLCEFVYRAQDFNMVRVASLLKKGYPLLADGEVFHTIQLTRLAIGFLDGPKLSLEGFGFLNRVE